MIFGNRFTKDYTLYKEIEKIEQSHPELSFMPVLSRENSGWKGETGYVHSVYEKLFAHKPPMYLYLRMAPEDKGSRVADCCNGV